MLYQTIAISLYSSFVQLADNSRRWGREKADLVLRKNETDYGFGRPIASPVSALSVVPIVSL